MKRLRPALITTATLLILGCSSPPQPPGVDDSVRRPVNSLQTIAVQKCQGELSASRVMLTEALNADAVRAAAARRSAPIAENRVFIVPFKSGSAEFQIPPEQQARFLELVRKAELIVIRGRTDALSESIVETRLAQRRAEGAAAYLRQSAQVPAERLRITWQGAGDRVVDGSSAAERNSNRRVEIELYGNRPRPEVLAAAS